MRWGSTGAWGCTMGGTRRENAALVRRFLSDVAAGGDVAAVEAFLAENFAGHDLVFGDGHAGTDFDWSVLAAADVDVEVEQVVATDEWVAVLATVSGTHREPLLELEPTGESFEVAYAWFCRVEEGRLAEIWSLPDGLGLLEQIGAIPDTPPE